ncbi:hypothetical protein ACFVFJ_14005 [Streptomyces sp. NPDC057717]|uniref:hypothetical protein n=1 Tax=Streptomyces sp. NPDC057717 TaxID=3346224 RepID=UPI0036B03EF5
MQSDEIILRPAAPAFTRCVPAPLTVTHGAAPPTEESSRWWGDLDLAQVSVKDQVVAMEAMAAAPDLDAF